MCLISVFCQIYLHLGFDLTLSAYFYNSLHYRLVPETIPFKHSCEGPDDMPAHAKACLLGSNLTLPICDGRVTLGTWQGVWLCEHRDRAGPRKVLVTVNGVIRDPIRTPQSPASPMGGSVNDF